MHLETNDEKQCVDFASLKGGFQRILCALFTCQSQGGFPMGSREWHRAEAQSTHQPVSRSVLPSHFPKLGLQPEGTLAVSFPTLVIRVCDF